MKLDQFESKLNCFDYEMLNNSGSNEICDFSRGNKYCGNWLLFENYLSLSFSYLNFADPDSYNYWFNGVTGLEKCENLKYLLEKGAPMDLNLVIAQLKGGEKIDLMLEYLKKTPHDSSRFAEFYSKLVHYDSFKPYLKNLTNLDCDWLHERSFKLLS